MNETPLSPGAMLAWKIAAYEARQLDAEYIEPEHIFIGLLSLDKLIERKDAALPVHANPELVKEWNAIMSLLEISGHDPVVLRRLMRQALGKGTSKTSESTIHRSPACRQYFSRAGKLAGDKPVTSNNLFSAILEKPGEVIPAVLAESRRYRAAERQTDIMLPSGESLKTTGGISGPGFDIIEMLSRDVRKYAASLEEWSPDTQEYLTVLAAMKQKGISLALLCLDDNDGAGLVSALRLLMPWSGDPERSLSPVITEVETATRAGETLSGEVRDRIHRLLLDLEKQVAQRTGK